MPDRRMVKTFYFKINWFDNKSINRNTAKRHSKEIKLMQICEDNINTIKQLLIVGKMHINNKDSTKYDKMRKEILYEAKTKSEIGIFNDDFLWKIWGSRNHNGIASIRSNNISKKEFQAIVDEIRELTKLISENNNHTTYIKAINIFKDFSEKK
jgi:hypothetical protein